MPKPPWLLIDGYNVIAPVAGPGRSPPRDWLARERRFFLQRLAKFLPATVRERTIVVFDAKNPPADSVDRFQFEDIEVRFAIEYPEADDLAEEIIAHHPAAKQLTVVSSDHRIQTAAGRRGASVFESNAWIDDLVDGRIRLAVPASKWRTGGSSPYDDPDSGKSNPIEKPEIHGDTDDWMREFGIE